MNDQLMYILLGAGLYYLISEKKNPAVATRPAPIYTGPTPSRPSQIARPITLLPPRTPIARPNVSRLPVTPSRSIR